MISCTNSLSIEYCKAPNNGSELQRTMLLSIVVDNQHNTYYQERLLVYAVSSADLLAILSYNVSGAISAPFGQAIVPPSIIASLKNCKFFSGSNIGPLSKYSVKFTSLYSHYHQIQYGKYNYPFQIYLMANFFLMVDNTK